jgi:hypothetical protein
MVSEFQKGELSINNSMVTEITVYPGCPAQNDHHEQQLRL